ncbi:hypothetical protein [Vannielia litorea]|uniref:hypothetical protein n=1 Tax=Vannielia litorea TaxID=1217970 RepID=UPI001BCA9BDB|nr:hypothetical protein [Vannielia litorea]
MAGWNIKWSTIARMGGNRLVRSSYIWLIVVPLCVKLLADIPGTSTVLLFDGQVAMTLDLPFSWKAFYAAAVLFTLANLTFLAFCPALVREFRDFRAFRDRGHGVEYLRDYLDAHPDHEPDYKVESVLIEAKKFGYDEVRLRCARAGREIKRAVLGHFLRGRGPQPHGLHAMCSSLRGGVAPDCLHLRRKPDLRFAPELLGTAHRPSQARCRACA